MRIDLTGKTFERWMVAYLIGNDRWFCKCICGQNRIVHGGNLRSGKSKSCGCLAIDINTTHGLKRGRKNPPCYSVWAGMKDRCYNPNNPQYKDYGGRGIIVCEKWKGINGFVNFINDIGKRPSMGHTLDRIDNDKNYEPNNCEWNTWRGQHGHTRKSRRIVAFGREMILADWVRELKMPHATLHYQLKYNSLESIIQNRKSIG